GVSSLLQRPSELVAQARLPIDIELVGTRELLGAGEDRVVRISQPLGCPLIVRVQICGGRALDKFRRDRLRKLVDLLRIEPLKNRHHRWNPKGPPTPALDVGSSELP